jgi:hypothetical protein
MMRLCLVALASILLVAGGQSGAATAEVVKHSGTIVEIDAHGAQLVLEEVGPWRVRDGVTQVIRRTIALTPATDVVIAVRVNPPGGYAGDFVEGPLAMFALEPGDVITVDCRREGPRLVAVKITTTSTP